MTQIILHTMELNAHHAVNL